MSLRIANCANLRRLVYVALGAYFAYRVVVSIQTYLEAKVGVAETEESAEAFLFPSLTLCP